jgi:hypothetical protein
MCWLWVMSLQNCTWFGTVSISVETIVADFPSVEVQFEHACTGASRENAVYPASRSAIDFVRFVRFTTGEEFPPKCATLPQNLNLCISH